MERDIDMIEVMARDCRYIAQANTPFRTGNLRFNSVRYNLLHNGFMIEASYAVAPYIHYLNEGTTISRKHIGWWSIKVAIETTNYVGNRLAGNTLQAQSTLYEAQTLYDETADMNTEKRFKTLKDSMKKTNAMVTRGDIIGD